MKESFFTIDIICEPDISVSFLLKHADSYTEQNFRYKLETEVGFVKKIIDTHLEFRSSFLALKDKQSIEECFVKLVSDTLIEFKEDENRREIHCDKYEKTVQSPESEQLKKYAARFYKIAINKNIVKLDGKGYENLLKLIPFSSLGMEELKKAMEDNYWVLPFLELDNFVLGLDVPFV